MTCIDSKVRDVIPIPGVAKPNIAIPKIAKPKQFHKLFVHFQVLNISHDINVIAKQIQFHDLFSISELFIFYLNSKLNLATIAKP